MEAEFEDEESSEKKLDAMDMMKRRIKGKIWIRLENPLVPPPPPAAWAC